MSSNSYDAWVEEKRRKRLERELAEEIRRKQEQLQREHEEEIRRKKEQFRQKVSDSVQALDEQLKTGHANTVQMSTSIKYESSIVFADDSISGYMDPGVILSESLLSDNSHPGPGNRNVLNFSDLLLSGPNELTPLESELESWVKKVDERPILNEQDENDKKRISEELAKIIRSSDDIEDKIKAIKMRVKNYLDDAARISEMDKEKMESTYYYEYCALCEMLSEEPTEKIPSRVKKEVSRMKELLQKRRQDEYIKDVLEEILEDLGCHMKEGAVLDQTEGQLYSVDGHPLCDVFVGYDSFGVLFEPVGEFKEGSLENQRRIEQSANSICSMYATLEERAAEKGVILKCIHMEPAQINKMHKNKEKRKRDTARKQRKATAPKQRVINPEDR